MDTFKPVNMLLIEDDPGDQKLIKISLKNQKISNDIKIITCGEDALEYLENCKNEQPGCEMPDLILLDLNMPGMGGKEFLRRLRQDEVLGKIPVVILTTSDNDKDILESFQLQASGYIRKPIDIKDFIEIMDSLTEYWFVVCKKVPHDAKCHTNYKVAAC